MGKNRDQIQGADWYKMSPDQSLELLGSSEEGLGTSGAEERLSQYGKNTLPARNKITLWEIVIHQFASPLIYVLIAAAIVSLFLKEYTDAGFIFMIMIINAIMGTYQEWKAESNASALQEMMKILSRVKRNGQTITLDTEQLVPGDIVLLESGNKVPADIRLITSNNLTIEEAILTGESLPVEKNSTLLPGSDLMVADRLNMAHAGTTVMGGRAVGVVTNTGIYTELGKIAKSLTEIEATTPPLVKRMEKFAKKVSFIVLGASILLGIIGLMSGISLEVIFFVVVAAAVSAIPEGLPIAMTVALSIGTLRMAKRNVIVRKLTAVEGLGSCTYIATDKTGTLTVDQQTVKILVLANGEEYKITGEGYTGEGTITDINGNIIKFDKRKDLLDFIHTVTICNEAGLFVQDNKWMHQGDAVDVALLALSYKAGSSPEEIVSAKEKLTEIPFESHKKYAAVYYKHSDGKISLAVKGAFEVLFSNAGNNSKELEKKATELAKKGYRIIAVAGNEVTEINEEALPPLHLLGIAALIDPLRPEARAAIEECHNAGVNVAMITGDHPSTALSIADELGIAHKNEQLITGAELGEILDVTEPGFLEKLKDKRVFARVSPAQKQKIVAALKHLGHFVAVTGDGVNDAPALKTANIGVAMGYGTDVAKDAASIIITDNNFASIAKGIEDGRYIYSNLRKIIYMLISTGAAELLMIGLSLGLGLPLPFLAVQLLWLNLVTNGIQDVSLAFEKGEKHVMVLPPRKPSEGFFDKLMIEQTIISGLTIALLTTGLWYHLLRNLHWDEASARNVVLLLMVLVQNFHVVNCRSEYRSALKIPLKNNPFLIGGILMAQGVHIIAMHIPFMQNLLRIKPVSVLDWLKLLGTASIIIIVMEVFKWYKKRTSPIETSDSLLK